MENQIKYMYRVSRYYISKFNSDFFLNQQFITWST